MGELDVPAQQLRALIGTRIQHLGLACRLIEVIDDGPAVVLQCEQDRVIQEDQHGAPTRHAPRTFTIPVFTGNRQGLNPDFLDLGLPLTLA